MKRLLSALTMAIIALSATPALAATTSVATKAAASTAYHYDRLFYYKEGDLAKQSFFAHYASIDIFAPQVYKINDDGTLSGTLDKDLLDFAKLHKVKVMPLVTNGGFSRTAYQAVLNDTTKQDIAINAMIKEAKDRGYIGWQFDFEQMDAADRGKYTAFMARAYAAMKAQNLQMSIAVIAQVSENPKDYKDGLWNSVIGVYDYRALAADADFISVMAYDDPDSKGAIAPWPWYFRVFTWAIATIPNNKISMGIGAYYWQWDTATRKLVGIGGNEGINNVFAKYNPTASYDSVLKAPVLHYKGATGATYDLWYENAQSVTDKVTLVKQNHLAGVSIWALGLEKTTIYPSLKE